ncbi:HECT-like ubiquitin conjugating enzyme-binding domain containing protein [Pleurostoma richardsiae]|uniref:HECT-like ubiquitin conjugating enzyme-binding domain containing protein n=1 Tax=Pleurostoma richardsiae TaxID=41990 RepID=A0AA38VF90_9PEZI|nr:HECT-like ubiquitin conjugating enzyme-binding domain containing protein [Pleurostoma richardsiae]
MAAINGTSPAISVYAELLPHIRRLSLAVSLPSAADSTTDVTLLHDATGPRLRVRHAGAQVLASLPARAVVPGGGGAVRLPLVLGRTEASWRVAVAADGGADHGGQAGAAAVPWESGEVAASGGVMRCRSCGHEIVVAAGPGEDASSGSGEGRKGVSEWLDLPSENWAEMMEFWHCHKPGDHDHGGHGHDGQEARLASSRGYGANSAIAARRGVGLVDVMTVLLAEEDCEGLTFSWTDFQSGSGTVASLEDAGPAVSAAPPSVRKILNVFCSACESRLGYFDFRTAAVTLFKWQILLSAADLTTSNGSPSSPHLRPPTISHFLAATIAAVLARSGSSKTLLMPILDGPVPLTAGRNPRVMVPHVWLLNGNIRYTYASSEAAGKQLPEPDGAVPAVKVLWRMVSTDEAERMLESLTGEAQEVGLPQEAIDDVVRVLEASNALLPRGERVFRGEWKVGLLERWET